MRFVRSRSRGIRSKFISAVALTVLFVSLVPCRAQRKMEITFDGPPTQPPGTTAPEQDYYESGMWFRGLNSGFGRVGPATPGYPDNGTAHLKAAPGELLVFSFTNGYLFNLVTVDLAEYSTVVSGPVTVQFVGYRPNGTTVTNQFTTDGIIDGTGPLEDFQTAGFSEFTELSRVEIPTSGWSLDRLIVGVPLQIGSFGLTNGNVALSFYSFSGLQYSAEYSTNLSEWFDLPGSTIIATGGDAQIVDTNGIGQFQKFYRLKQ